MMCFLKTQTKPALAQMLRPDCCYCCCARTALRRHPPFDGQIPGGQGGAVRRRGRRHVPAQLLQVGLHLVPTVQARARSSLDCSGTQRPRCSMGGLVRRCDEREDSEHSQPFHGCLFVRKGNTVFIQTGWFEFSPRNHHGTLLAALTGGWRVVHECVGVHARAVALAWRAGDAIPWHFCSSAPAGQGARRPHGKSASTEQASVAGGVSRAQRRRGRLCRVLNHR
jgi:hypothetical protein